MSEFDGQTPAKATRSKRRKIKAATALAGAAVLFGGGTAFGNYLASDDGPASSGNPAPASSVQLKDIGQIDHNRHDAEIRTAQASKIDVVEAADAALAEYPEGIATSAGLDSDQGSLVWELDVLDKDGTWHEVIVDAGNAKVLSTRTERDGDDAQNTREARAAKVSLEEAAETATAEAPGTVSSVSLDDEYRDKTRLNWEIEIQGADGRQHDVTVDAANGLVLEGRIDQDD